MFSKFKFTHDTILFHLVFKSLIFQILFSMSSELLSYFILFVDNWVGYIVKETVCIYLYVNLSVTVCLFVVLNKKQKKSSKTHHKPRTK